MAEYTLTIYADDDATPLFEVGTAKAHPNPYLHYPENFEEAGVDLVRGGAVIGQYNLQIIDPQTGATKSDRWLTSRLPSASGHTALIRRRAVFRRTSPDTAVIMDGVVGKIVLSESFAGFEVDIRDVRERAREVKVFSRTGTTSILPRGVVDGYGRIHGPRWITRIEHPSGYLVPRVQPITGTFTLGGSTPRGSWGWFTFDDRPVGGPELQEVPPYMAMSDAAQEALASPELFEIWWREGSGSAWKKLQNIRTVENPDIDPDSIGSWYTQAGPLSMYPAITRDSAGGEIRVTSAYGTFVDDYQSSDPLPLDGATAEVLVVYVGEPTEEFPFHWEGEWGEFVSAMLDGQFSRTPPRVRYNAAAVAAIRTPVRIRATEAKGDLRSALEEMCRAVGAAPALDENGDISPIRYELPTTVAGMVALTDGNCQPIPGWEHPSDNAITVAEVAYHRDIHVPLNRDPTGRVMANDTIVEKEIRVRRTAPEEVLNIMGEEVLEIDAWMFRSLGGDAGEPLYGDVSDEQGWKAAEVAKNRAVDRFVFGGQESWLRTTADVQVGDWVLDQRSWRPDYQTGKRGGSTLAQITSVRRVDEAWLAVQLVDAAPEDQPLAAPTLGALSQSDGVVTIPVTAVPADGEAVVEYAVTDGDTSSPPENDPSWTHAGRVSAPTDVYTPKMPSGARVWVRARAEAPGRLRSEWISGGSITITATFHFRTSRLFVRRDGSAVFQWEAPASVGGVRLEWVTHPRGQNAPPFDSLDDISAEGGEYVWPAGTVPLEHKMSLGATPYEGYDVSLDAVYGGSGVRREYAAERHVGEVPHGSVSAYVTSDGAVFFSFSGNPAARSFAWKISKTAYPTDSAGATVVDAQSGEVSVDPATFTLGADEKGFITGWFYNEAAGAGDIGPPVHEVATRGAQGPPGPEGSTDTDLAIYNFRVVEETDSYRDYAWDTGPLVEEVWIYDWLDTIPGPANPWPGATTDPVAILGPGQNTYRFYFPDTSHVRRGQVEPRMEDAGSYIAGPFRRLEMYPPPLEVPHFIYLRQVSTVASRTSDVHGQAHDPAANNTTDTGSLKVWVNAAGTASPDPSALPDAVLTVGSFPFTFGPTTVFDDGSKPLDNIPWKPGSTKTVFLELEMADGRTTGRVPLALEDKLDLVDEVGELRAGSIQRAAQFASDLDPVLVLGSVPATHQGSNVIHVGGKLYRWDGSAYVKTVDTTELVGEIVRAQIADAAINVAKFAGGIEPVTIHTGTALPTTKSTNSLYWNGKLYRWSGTAYTAAVPTGDLTGTITETQITDGAISTPKLAAEAVTAGKIAANTITAGQIAAGAIATDELAAGAVTAGKIYSGTVQANRIQANNIAAGAITATEIATDAVTAAKILAGAVVAGKIAAGAVKAEAIDAGAVTTVKLAANAVTAGKIDVINLSAINADLGYITAGHLRNPGNTAAIRLSGSNALPTTNYLDFTATTTAPFLKHPGLTLLANGDATFSGDLAAAGGTFSGTVAATDFDATYARFHNGTGSGEIQVGEGASGGSTTYIGTDYIRLGSATGTNGYIERSATGFDLVFRAKGSTTLTESMRLLEGGGIRLSDIPTTNPGGTGNVWNDGGFLRIT